MRFRGLEVLIPLALAIPLGLMIGLSRPETSLMLLIGGLVLLVAFLSTTASLYILVFSMLLSPEFLVGELAGGAAASRGITLRFDDFLLVVFGFVWLAKVAIRKEDAPFFRTPLNGPIMFYIAVSVFATLIGVMAGRVNPKAGFFFVLKYYEYVFLYFMVVNAVASQKQAKNLLIASLVTCFLVSLYAIAQVPSGQRASAPFEGEYGEPNTLGGYLVFMLAIVTGLLLTKGSVPSKIPLLLLMGVGSLGLMATLSRSSFLAGVAVVIAVSALLAYRRPLLLPFALIAILTAPWWLPAPVSERIMFTFTQPTEEGQIRVGRVRVDTSTSDRLRSWQQSLAFFQRSPVWGAGVTGGPFMDAMYPRVLTETGLLGFLAFLFLLWSIFRVGLTAFQQAQEPFSRGMALGFLLGFFGLLVHAIGANTFLIVRIMEPFWLVAALVVRSLLIRHAVPPAGGGAQSDLAGDMRSERRTTAPVLRGSGTHRYTGAK
jgi:O-antigen ligase